MLALLILNFTLAKERHEKARGIARWSRDTWPFPIMAPSVLKPRAGILLIMTTALLFTMLLFVSPSKPMDSVPVHSANQLTVTPNLQAESSFPLMVPGGQRDAGKINGPFPCRYNTQYVNSSYWMWTVYNQHAPIQRGRFHSA